MDGEHLTHRLLEEQGGDDEDVAAASTGCSPGPASRYDLTRTGRRSHRWVQSLSETWGEMACGFRSVLIIALKVQSLSET